MLLARSGGIFGVLVALIVAGIFMFVVRPAINDTTERAFQTADRALDEAAQRSDEVRATVAEATADLGTTDYLSAAAFGAVVSDLNGELGAGAELLDVTVTRTGGGNVKYRVGDRAAGFTWGPGRDGLQPVKVTLIGSGKIEDNVFPIGRLSPAATAKLTAAVQERIPGFDVQSMTLGLAPVTGDLRWTVTGEGNGRSLVFTARSNGSGLQKVG
jgi:hypothetical protein